MGYSRDAVKGLSWMSGLQFLIRTIGIVKIIIIARILTPADLGIFGITVLILGLFETLTDIGISTFLIQLKSNISEYIDSAWTIQLGRGFLLSILLASVSIPVSIFFRNQLIIIPMIFLSLIPFLKSLENPYIIIFQKELVFHREFVYRLIFVVSDFVISVYLALITRSYFSLIFGLLFSTGIGIFFSWILIKMRPKLRFQISKVKKIFSFISYVTPIGILMYLINNTDQIVVGKFFGTGALGVYQMAEKFSNTPMIELSDIFGKVSLPIYTKIAFDTRRLVRAYIKTVLLLFCFELAVTMFLFSFSKEIIFLTVGSQWLSSVEILKIFALYGFVFSVSGTIGSLFYSLGKPEVLTKTAIIRLGFFIPILWYGIKWFGILGAVYASLISSILILPYIFWCVYKIFAKQYPASFS